MLVDTPLAKNLSNPAYMEIRPDEKSSLKDLRRESSYGENIVLFFYSIA
jgi:hypothetical protein